MGCQGSKTGEVAEQPQLTEDKKKKVRESWALYLKDENLKHNACLIFVKLFEMAPASKELFNFVEEVTEEALMDNERLHVHAKRVTDAISLVINNMDDAEVVSKAVSDLGGRHFHYGAKEDYIMPVAHGVLFALERTLKDKFTEDHKKAWLAVLTMVGQLFAKGLKEKGSN